MTRLSHSPSPRSLGRWVVWMPALLVGALFYWTVALGLGGLSLLAVSALSGTDGDGDAPEGAAVEPGEDPAQDPVGDAIVVHLQESAEALPGEAKSADVDAVDRDEDEGTEDVDDNPGAIAPSSVEATAVEPAPGS